MIRTIFYCIRAKLLAVEQDKVECIWVEPRVEISIREEWRIRVDRRE